jgi:very-short-patch-repair endonuclease
VEARKNLRNDPNLKHRRRKLRLNQTDAEKTLWKQLRNRQLAGTKFFRQFSIGPYILDFYCPQLRLAIELDGGQHTGENEREYDAARTASIQAQGIGVMRFWNHEVLNQTKSVLQKILEHNSP